MTVLSVGLIIWVVAHFFKRAAPTAREQMIIRFGAGGARGIIAGCLVLSVILMILGYRSADYIPIYDPMPQLRHLTILMMLAAVALLGMGHSKGRARTWLRHPMLIGVIVWACAHLLMRGDLAAVILFGGLGVWAIAEILVINRTVGAWVRPEPGPAKGDVKLVIITLVMFTIFVGLHSVLGPNPFTGG